MSEEHDLATLTLNVSNGDKSPLYKQLVKEIRNLLVEGQIKPGAKLPSSRKLALMLAVSRTTTLNAYNQLIADGLLISKPAIGVFASSLEKTPSSEVAFIGPDSTSLWDEYCEGSSSSKSFIFDTGPDAELFPGKVWARSLSRSWKNINPALLRNFPRGGYFPLRLAICRYLKALRNIDCRPEQVIITAGSRDGLSIIAKAVSVSGGRVLMEDPAYPPLRESWKAHDIELNSCTVDQEGMRLPDTKADLAWMTPARQYPLGISMSTERRLSWLQYSKENSCWIVEDDFDSEFQYQKSHTAPLINLSKTMFSPENQRLIYSGSFSKSMFRTLRIGYLVVPGHAVDAFTSAQSKLGSLASLPMQPALADFISQKHFSAHLRKMKKHYQQRRDFLYSSLDERLGDKLKVEPTNSGMHVVVKFKLGKVSYSDMQVADLLLENGFTGIPLSKHFQNKSEQGLILGFSGVDESRLALGVDMLASLLDG